MNKRIFFIAARWIGGIALFCLGYRLVIAEAAYHAGSFDGIFKMLSGIASWIGAAILLGPELVSWASIPVQAVFNALFWPGESASKPPADYTLGRSYRRQERYEESIEQYLRIIHYHPEELDAYLEGIETAFEAQTPEAALKFLRLGEHRLRPPEAREQVRDHYNSRVLQYQQELEEQQELERQQALEQQQEQEQEQQQ